MKFSNWLFLLKFSLAIFCIFTLFKIINLPSYAQNNNFTRLDKYIIQQMNATHIPGLSVGIVKDNKVIYLKGFGIADSSRRPVKPETPFIIGSMSKSFTALAIMQLAEAGKIDLNSPVQKYIPWFRVADPNFSSEITVRELLNQTSGLSTYVGWRKFVEQDNKSLEQLVHDLSNTQLNNRPGEKFEYSNANYLILGLIVESVSHQSYGEYVKDHIFSPLDMRNSFTSYQSASKDGLAAGYQQWLSYPIQMNYPYLVNSLPAGYLIASADDMTHYLTAQMNGGEYNSTSILSSNGISELHKPAIDSEKDQTYGMGWYEENVNGTYTIWHSGLIPNYNSYMAIMPKEHLGIVVLTNMGLPMSAQYIGRGLTSILLNKKSNENDLSPTQFYLLVDVAILLLIFLTFWSIFDLIQWIKKRKNRKIVSFALIRDITLLVIYFLVLSEIATISVPKMIITFIPDLGYVLLISMMILLINMLIRVVFIMKSNYKNILAIIDL